AVYAIYLADEGETALPAYLSLTEISPAAGATVTLLGTDTSLKWEPAGTGFVAEVPARLRSSPPGAYAWAFRISAIDR
ncbi:MAG: alpha-L-fucosidase, partial [Gemmatimonadales bacterium]|nr:alpha-L-fucosidase [Gemmatimonadales bacterium]